MPNYKRIFQNGHSYFLTMTTYGRNPILIENIELLRKSFCVSKQNYDYTIDAIVVLPDHIHMILTLDNAKNSPKSYEVSSSIFQKDVIPNIMCIIHNQKAEIQRGIFLFGKRDFLNIPYATKKI